MTVLQALVLGLVQGITEMLPISSSGHLLVVPFIFKFDDPGLAFSVALHIGTLLALVLYFWRDWLKIAHDLLLILRRRKIETFEQKLAGFLVVASVPGAIFGLLLEEQAETVFRSPLIIVFTLTTLGILLLVADKRENSKKITEMKVTNALTIGFAQALALVPGVSRSGITMTTGLFSGFRRGDAAKFSFMMSAPIIAGAGLLKLKDIAATDLTTAFWVGFFASAISSLLAIGFLLRYVRKHRFTLFAYYRFALASLILTLIILRG